MNSSGQRARDLFVAALRLTPEQWDEFLRRECADDTALHDRAKALLRAHAEAGSFLDRPAAAPVTDTQTAADDPGEVVGPYKLLEVIGEGGMGTVWMAEQTAPVRRLVALKLVKPGLDSRPVLARFEAERQALALMDHPNIAKVLDAGLTDIEGTGPAARPYFVMELVKGVPITAYCDAHRLTPRQRLELFIPVCEAIQHAHQKGIIHRDVKPSNVLVARYDDKPVPKVIDFGVAKAVGSADGLIRLTERTLHTAYGAVVGTVEYMSPEQAGFNQLDVDTRSDIYSLGVLLYELLTGGPPLGRAEVETVGLLETLRLIREQDPPRPSTRLSTADGLPALASNRGTEPKRLAALVRGELDWIVMKALEKDRNRRYETANSFAMDVRRYLADEPVQACPPSTAYRVRKFARRHTTALAAAAAVAAALATGAAIATWQAVVAIGANRDAQAAAADATTAKETAEARAAETRAVLKFVEDRILAAARPQGQLGGLGRTVSLRQAVEAAVPHVEASFTTEPLIEARLRMTLGQSFVYLGDAKAATEHFRRARALYADRIGPDHPDTLMSVNGLAISYASLGRHTDACPLFEETLALRKAKLGSDHPDTLMSMNNLANSYYALDRLADAVKLREEALAQQKARLGPDHRDTLMSMNNLATDYAALGRLADALLLREETLVLRRRRLGPDHPDTLGTMNNLANSYAALKRHEDALRLREETLALRKAKLGPDHPATLMSMNNLANSYRDLKRHRDALPLREETLALRKAKLDPDHPDTLHSMNSLANCYADLGRYADARALNEETLTLRKAKLGPDHPDTLWSMNNLAVSYYALGRHDEALTLHQETLAKRVAKLGDKHPDTLVSEWGVARCLVRLGRGAEAVPLIDDCVRRAAGQVVDPELIPGVTDLRLRHFEKTRDAAGCRATAELWETLNRTEADGLYTAARLRAVTAAVIGATDTSAEAAEQAAAEADRAMEWLKRAVAAGYKDVANMTKDNDIDALRGREDFRALLKELRAAAQKN